jgi:hypothetical protein
MKLILPIIHPNGSDAARLARQYGRARRMLRDAILTLEKVEFNARDYYPMGDEVWKIAREQHAARFTALEQINRELAEIEQHIADQL